MDWSIESSTYALNSHSVAQQMIDKEPRKRPIQGRSKATFDAIVEAGAHIVARDGYDNVTTNDIAERAGVSIGSLYQYFPTKEAILLELLRNKRKKLRLAFDKALGENADVGLQVAFGEIVAAVMEHQYLIPNLARFVETADQKLAVESEGEDLEHHIAERLAERLAIAGYGTPQKSAFEIVGIARGLIRNAGLSSNYSKKELSDKATLAITAYLGAIQATSQIRG